MVYGQSGSTGTSDYAAARDEFSDLLAGAELWRGDIGRECSVTAARVGGRDPFVWLFVENRLLATCDWYTAPLAIHGELPSDLGHLRRPAQEPDLDFSRFKWRHVVERNARDQTTASLLLGLVWSSGVMAEPLIGPSHRRTVFLADPLDQTHGRHTEFERQQLVVSWIERSREIARQPPEELTAVRPVIESTTSAGSPPEAISKDVGEILAALTPVLVRRLAAAAESGIDLKQLGTANELASSMVDALPVTDPSTIADRAGPFYSVADTAAYLGLTPDIVEKQIERSDLLGARSRDGEHHVPTWQFAEDGEVIRDLVKIASALREQLSDCGALLWLTQPRRWLGGVSPAKWVRAGGDIELVLTNAHDDLSAWRQ